LAASDLEATLLSVLPPELHDRLPALAGLLRDAAAGRLTPDELQRRLSGEPALVPLLAALAGQSFVVDNTTITSGDAGQRDPTRTAGTRAVRDLVVVQTGGGDYAGGDIDKRQGQFFQGGIHIHYSGRASSGVAPALPYPEPARPPEVADFVGREAEMAY